ncbi:hypothetical protein [Moorena sp. SIO4G3]|uniref:hypothetical protein n=1 Tax=Moorena sp. SIO4G3 TaxID=2607821 RepID=UPI00142CD43B|nr:hypothetical protein [Moorena sp. SIO4G3]NEO80734.1 hypothetical protein [Moorena sp. SIO4G3]
MGRWAILAGFWINPPNPRRDPPPVPLNKGEARTAIAFLFMGRGYCSPLSKGG